MTRIGDFSDFHPGSCDGRWRVLDLPNSARTQFRWHCGPADDSAGRDRRDDPHAITQSFDRTRSTTPKRSAVHYFLFRRHRFRWPRAVRLLPCQSVTD